MMKMAGNLKGIYRDVDISSVNFTGKFSMSNTVLNDVSCYEVYSIVDTRATDHMCAQRDLFTQIKMLNKPILVSFPDGSTKRVDYAGNVEIISQLVLNDVLFFPNFKHNLMLVHKILISIGKLMQFDANGCVL
ncbi:hypothetical protein RND81_05G022100 [Saponaria officinalis]|uniref:Retrovirus-related Pol polyprotein from transposon TNT 1-94-like beta-barrel domain-containing protein n=1 Tax=Saponaria officinalis TaxID=3572 RepID=A0AAW1KWM9_SAPOF